MKHTLHLYFYITITAFLINSEIKAQSMKEANALYDSYAYAEAGKMYEKLLKKDKNKSKSALMKLADSYYFNGKYIKALQPYSQIMKMPGEVTAIYYFRYSQCLRANAEYKKSDEYLLKYYNMIGKEDLIRDKLKTNYLDEIKKNEASYVIKKLKINSENSDYGASFYGKDKLIFASSRESGRLIKRKQGWNGEAFTKLYESVIKTDGTLEKPTLLSGDINTKYNQSSAAITKDGNTMYFTRNNYFKNKLGISDAKVNYLKIYRATKINGEWTNIEDLPINGDNHANAHPTLSHDDKTLYYVSDKMGGYGDTDIYEVEILENGNLKTPVNLGDKINTMHKETFPFISESGILYFSSNGHMGRGGLDVFAAYKDINTGEYYVYNIGGEINSTADDFGFIINEQNKRGFFTSNRGRGAQDNIYAFEQKSQLINPFEIKVRFNIADSLSNLKLDDVFVTIYDHKDNIIDKLELNSNDETGITLSNLAKYRFRFDKKGYIRYELITNINTEGLYSLDIKLLPEAPGELTIVYDKDKVTKISSGDDLMKKIYLNPIYFDYGGYNLRASSKRNLNRLVNLMKEYPNIVVNIRSHSDSRSSSDFNLNLSKRRSKTVVEYIIASGISSDRVSGDGYGDTQILNHCKKGVNCSSREHQLNRRSEIIVSIRK